MSIRDYLFGPVKPAAKPLARSSYPTHRATGLAMTISAGAETTPRQRLARRLEVYRLALEQNTKGAKRAEVLRGYIRSAELRLEAISREEEALMAVNSAEAEKDNP